jgi:hypothetical protein
MTMALLVKLTALPALELAVIVVRVTVGPVVL